MNSSQLLDILKSTKNDHLYNIQSMIAPIGKYNIERDQWEAFWTYYCDEVMKGTMLGLAERPGGMLPILADVDLKIPIDLYYERGNCVYTDQQLVSVIDMYTKVLTQTIQNVKPHNLYCFVFEKPERRIVTSDGKEFMKRGFHLAFPWTFCASTDQEQHIIPRINNIADRNTSFKDVGFASATKLLDHCHLKNAWLMYGSQKDDKEETHPYRLTRVFNDESEEVRVVDALSGYKLFTWLEQPIEITSKNYEYYLPRIFSTISFARFIFSKPQFFRSSLLIAFNNIF